MKPFSSLLVLAVTALTFMSAPLHASSDDKRPRLEQFSSYDEFMKAMVAWESRPPAVTAATAKPAAAPQPAKEPSTRPIPLPEGVDPTSETAPPPLAITGPEDLETAVELAKDITHPDYKARIRYNRTTHLSFPLQSIDGSDMSQASVENALMVDKSTLDNDTTLPGIDQKLDAQNKFNPGEPNVGGTSDIYAGITLRQPTLITIESTY